MTETIPKNNELSYDPRLMEVSLAPDIGLHYAAEMAKIGEWHETGECHGPTTIASLQLTDEAISTLLSGVSQRYGNLATARELAGLEIPDRPVSDEALAVLEAIESAFNSVVEHDIASNDQDLRLMHTETLVGIYLGGQSGVHIDGIQNDVEVPKDNIRYLLTFVGPGTVHFTGQFPDTEFAETKGKVGKDFTGDQIPATATQQPQATGLIQRFVASCDPHAGPSLDQPVLRGVCNKSVKPRWKPGSI